MKLKDSIKIGLEGSSFLHTFYLYLTNLAILIPIGLCIGFFSNMKTLLSSLPIVIALVVGCQYLLAYFTSRENDSLHNSFPQEKLDALSLVATHISYIFIVASIAFLKYFSGPITELLAISLISIFGSTSILELIAKIGSLFKGKQNFGKNSSNQSPSNLLVLIIGVIFDSFERNHKLSLKNKKSIS